VQTFIYQFLVLSKINKLTLKRFEQKYLLLSELTFEVVQFLIYINDLIALLARYNIKVKLFADDVKLYVKVVNAVDAAVLHEALAALVSWADEWQLSVSVNKCGVLCIGKDCIVEHFSINNTALLLLLILI